MNMSRLRQNLIREEGLELNMYKCPADHWTIGVGHNLESRGISEDIAMAILDEDIETCLAELRVGIRRFADYPEAIQETLVDLCFNMGISRLLKFSKTLGYLEEGLETGNYTKAAIELLNSNYAKQLPARAKRNHDRIFNA